MSKTFRAWDVDQGWLLPPSVHQFVPPGHLAHFVRDTVREALDLSAISGVYTAAQGQPPYHPGMLTALLLYGYSRVTCSPEMAPFFGRVRSSEGRTNEAQQVQR